MDNLKHKHEVNEVVITRDSPNADPYTVVIHELLGPVLPEDLHNPLYRTSCLCHGEVVMVNESEILGGY